jgi:hypothetical protein
MVTSAVPLDATPALAVADTAARLLLAGMRDEARLLLEETPAASAFVLERAVMLAEAKARRGDTADFAHAAERVLDLLWGADAERAVDAVCVLAAHALALGEATLCAHLVQRATSAARVLAIRSDETRLKRLERLADDAVEMSNGLPTRVS